MCRFWIYGLWQHEAIRNGPYNSAADGHGFVFFLRTCFRLDTKTARGTTLAVSPQTPRLQGRDASQR